MKNTDVQQTVRVWAPRASSVVLEADGRRTKMRPDRGGWFTSEYSLPPGADYAFVLDGNEPPLPDPRSPWQPNGVHGPSRTLCGSSFPWTDQAWRPAPLKDAIFYELHVGTFTAEGTFEAAVAKLGYLKELGITHIELMPVNEFPGDWGWGYDGVDLFAPHHAYGMPEDLKRLVNACHAHGLAVILDVVYNHLGPSGNYLSRFGPYFTDCYLTPWGQAVNLDGRDSHEVRRFFCDNALMWLGDYHFDGLRLDAVHAFLDRSAVHFLEQLSTEVDALGAQLGRPLTLIAESDLNDPRVVRPREQGGYGMAAQWNDDFHHSLHTALTGESAGYYSDFHGLEDLARVLTDVFVYDGRFSTYRGRPHGRPPRGISGDHFLAYLQNHDQIGNRARGERSSMLMSHGRLKVGAAVTLTSPFVPMLFMGEEWGACTPFQYATSHTDAELAAAVSVGRRSEFADFGWTPEEVPDPQDAQTFHRSKLDWSELSRPQCADILDWHRRLIRLRSEWPELTDADVSRVQVECDADQGWMRMQRGRIVAAFNISAEERRIPAGAEARLLECSHCGVRLNGGTLTLPPDTTGIIASE